MTIELIFVFNKFFFVFKFERKATFIIQIAEKKENFLNFRQKIFTLK